MGRSMTKARNGSSGQASWYAGGSCLRDYVLNDNVLNNNVLNNNVLNNNAARAVEPGEVPAAQRADLDPRSGVRRVDEHAAAEVEPDVTEIVEEDEVAGP